MPECPLEIAIVGGGIVGLALAVGLRSRGVEVKVYEQSRGFREIGAGVAFTACARRCMGMIDPAVAQAFRSCGAMGLKSADLSDPNDYLSWVDGYNQRDPSDPDLETPLFKLDAGYSGFAGTRRDQFLEAVAKAIPDGVVEFRKRLCEIKEGRDDEPIELLFDDGTCAKADAVIGCDGLKSRVREYLFGKDNPISYASYTNKFAYRGLVSMENAIKALGEHKAKYFTIHLGPGAHMLHYPVANGAMVNVVAFVSDSEEWTDKNLVRPATRTEMENVFTSWHQSVRALASYFPEQIDKWGLFDSFESPAPYYNRDRICLLGDAAHASAPHHGAGAGMGIEDAACMAALLGEAALSLKKGHTSKQDEVRAAFKSFDQTRRKRTQWFVNSSRRVCDLFQSPDWADPAKWVKAETCWEEVKDRSRKIWDFDPDLMVTDAIKTYLTNLREINETKKEPPVAFDAQPTTSTVSFPTPPHQELLIRNDNLTTQQMPHVPSEYVPMGPNGLNEGSPVSNFTTYRVESKVPEVVSVIAEEGLNEPSLEYRSPVETTVPHPTEVA